MARQSKEKKREAVNVHDQQMMINEGLHPNYRVVPDFSKTPEEKAKLYLAKLKEGKGFYNQKWAYHSKKNIPVYGKLILYVKGENTKSIYCGQADIPEILIRIKKNEKELIKYQWNGRTYTGGNLPEWKPKIKGGKSLSVRSYAV